MQAKSRLLRALVHLPRNRSLHQQVRQRCIQEDFRQHYQWRWRVYHVKWMDIDGGQEHGSMCFEKCVGGVEKMIIQICSFPDPQVPLKGKENCLPNFFTLTIGCVYFENFMKCPNYQQTKECQELRALFKKCRAKVKFTHFYNYFTRLIDIERALEERQFTNGFWLSE